MLKEKDVVVRRLMIAFDLLVITAAFLVSYLIRSKLHSLYKFDLFPSKRIIADSPERFSEYLLVLIVVAPLWCFLLHRNGIYNSWRLKKAWNILWIVFKSSLSTIFISGAVFFLFRWMFVSRIFFVIFVLFGFLFLVGEKAAVFSIMHKFRRRGYNYRQLLIVGTGRRAEEFVRRIGRHPEWGLRVVGAIEDEAGRGIEKVDGVRVIGELEQIIGILHRLPIDEVVFVVPRLRLQKVEKAIHECEIEGVKVTVAVDLFDLKIAKSYQTELDGIPLLSFKTTVPDEWQLFLKRAMDVLISGILILILSPILLAIGLFIKITSKGPVLFKQSRIGFNKRRFTLYKYRTMFVGAQENLSKVNIYKEIYEPEWKDKKLKYMTPVGKLMRKFSLDELPQLFNVFLGHMSLVGPRPTLPEEVEQYQNWHRRRFSMRPGVTCLWQVQGRRKIQLNEWMQLDLKYLDSWSLWLDIKILLKTIPAVFFGHGAY